MNVRQLEAALKERAALPSGRRPKRAQLVAALKKWIDQNRSKGTSSLSAESGLSVVKCNINLHRPSEVCFAPVADVPLRLLVGCTDGMLVCLKIGSDGLVISGTTLFKTALHSVPLSGLAYCDEGLFITSPCPHNGGIFISKFRSVKWRFTKDDCKEWFPNLWNSTWSLCNQRQESSFY